MAKNTEVDQADEVARALDEAAAYNRQAKCCHPQHIERLYRRKDKALQAAIEADSGQFIIDSVSEGCPLILGLSHRLSSRRFHLRPDRMPPEVQAILAQLPTELPFPDRTEACGYGTEVHDEEV